MRDTIEEQTVVVGTRIAMFASALLAITMLARALSPTPSAPSSMVQSQPAALVQDSEAR